MSQYFRDAEVAEIHPATGVQKDVRRLSQSHKTVKGWYRFKKVLGEVETTGEKSFSEHDSQRGDQGGGW